ncbi:MAG: SpoIID/LytB domain-containing protein [Dysosmobacter welbionis]
MTLGEYLVGVVRAEMPASFEPEALKAQAVAARTYTLYKMQTGGNHGDTADICTDSTAARRISRRKTPGTTGARTRTPMRKRSRPPSGRPTERPSCTAACPSWRCSTPAPPGRPAPPARCGSATCPISRRCLRRSLRTASPTITAVWNSRRRSSGRRSWPLSGGGPVRRHQRLAAKRRDGHRRQRGVGGRGRREHEGQHFTERPGAAVRLLEWEAADGKLVFFVTGYGHGVGMSQYGANQMAKEERTTGRSSPTIIPASPWSPILLPP